MTALLRQARNVARLPSSSIRCATRSSLRTSPVSPFARSQLASQRSRAYASVQPKEPKEPKKDDKEAGTQKASEPPSKSAPGSEHLYDGSKSPMSPPPTGGNKDAPIGPNMVKLSPEDEKAIDELMATLRKGMPKGQAEIMENAMKAIKEQGIPKEIREIMDSLKSGEKMTVGTAAKLVRLTSNVARQMAEKSMGKDSTTSQSSTNFNANEPKTDDKQDGSKKKGPLPDGFKTTEIKMDTSTLLLAAFVAYLLYRLVIPGEASRDITWQEFRTTFFDKGLVEKLTVVNGNRVRVDLHREATQSMYPESPAANSNFHYYFTVGSVEAFERRLDDAQAELGIPSSERIPVSYVSEGALMNVLLSFGPTLLFIGVIFYMSKRAGGGAGGGSSGIFGMGKSKAKMYNHEQDVKVKFKDVAGMDEAKMEIMEFVSFLKTPGQFQRLGAKIPRGAILSGPPGTGKTLLAKATAGESEVPFFSVSGSEFVEMFVGVGASRVRDLFAKARKNTPCIIFIDEIDAIGKSRSKGGNFSGGNDEREATLNQILTEMDGFNTTEQIVVLAGTNRPDVLDKALMRPGRFDRHIAIDSPTMEGRKQIFLVHLGKIVTHENLEYLTGRLAALTPGFSGADIANVVNEAALIGKYPRIHDTRMC